MRFRLHAYASLSNMTIRNIEILNKCQSVRLIVGLEKIQNKKYLDVLRQRLQYYHHQITGCYFIFHDQEHGKYKEIAEILGIKQLSWMYFMPFPGTSLGTKYKVSREDYKNIHPYHNPWGVITSPF